VLVLHGSEDIRAEVRNAYDIYERAASTDKALVVLPGARHQLFQDRAPVTRRAMQEVVRWANAHAPY